MQGSGQGDHKSYSKASSARRFSTVAKRLPRRERGLPARTNVTYFRPHREVPRECAATQRINRIGAALLERETTSIHLWSQPRTHFIHTILGNPADIPDWVSLWPRPRFILSRQSSQTGQLIWDHSLVGRRSPRMRTAGTIIAMVMAEHPLLFSLLCPVFRASVLPSFEA